MDLYQNTANTPVHPAWSFLLLVLVAAPILVRLLESSACRNIICSFISLTWWKRLITIALIMTVTLVGADKGGDPIRKLFKLLFWQVDMTWMLDDQNEKITFAAEVAATASNRLDAAQAQVEDSDVYYISFDWHAPNRLPDVPGAPWHERQNVLAWTCQVIPTNINGVLYEDHYVAFSHAASTNPAVINIEYAVTLSDGSIFRQTSSTITNSYPDTVAVTLQSGTYDCYWFRCQVPDFFADLALIRDWNGEALFGAPPNSDRGFDLTGVLVIDDGNDVWEGKSGDFDFGGGEIHTVTNGIIVTQTTQGENGGAEI